MTDVELKKLNRAELLTMLMSITQRCDDLEEELEVCKKELAKKDIEINKAGTLAEAAVRINGVFEAADQAAEQYLQNVKMQFENQETITRELMEATEARCRKAEQETKEKCEEMIAKAKEESQAYWDEVYERLQQYCQTMEPLQALLSQIKN